MDKTARTRDLFLALIALTFMFAFASLYVQVPGLYGRNGIKPVHNWMQQMIKENKQSSQTAESYFMKEPTLLWFIKLEPHLAMELLCILGVLLSFVCMIWKRVRTMPTYFLLWLFYLSVYKVGDTFLWFQWDILLLEVGFLSILVAPLSNKNSDAKTEANIHKEIPFWLVKWLLFRLMFASGVVKLTSQCPTWWGLTALNYHYESQCIPTPLAWWAHQLPDAVQQFSVIGTYIIEICLPFFFFVPLRPLRLFAGYAQIFLMVAIYLTGNYNFFNILTVVLCLSLFDDNHLSFLSRCLSFEKKDNRNPPQNEVQGNKIWNILYVLLNLSIFATFIYVMSTLFTYNGKFKLTFNKEEFNTFVKWSLPRIIFAASFLFVLRTLYVSSRVLVGKTQTLFTFVSNLIKLSIIILPSVFILTASMVPLCSLEPSVSRELSPIAHRWHRSSSTFDLTHSYGLFRRMTGVGGRPEVVIEGSNSLEGPWKEYEFYYKPGDRTYPLTWTAPHQPRLDWQMWFASLSSYQHNPWILSLMHRILLGQNEVLDLMDRTRSPYPVSPPKYIRSQLYLYHYTKLNKNNSAPRAWWTRTLQKEYSPPITKDNVDLLAFLNHHNMMPAPLPKKQPPQSNVVQMLNQIRILANQVSPPYLLWSLAFTALAIVTLGSMMNKKKKIKDAVNANVVQKVS
nr:lipase maturation factor 2-like [Ciona intestinalis]|eukprot:XP_018671948.1 lipase maturation factor 2-like [Ciona intestinalis]